MALVAVSSTAWTRSPTYARSAPAAVAADRIISRTSASRPTSAGMRIVRIVAAGVIGSAEPGVIGGRPLEVAAVARPAGELPVPDDHRAARHDDVAGTLDDAALVARVVDVHVVRAGGDRPPAVRVVDQDV